MPRQRALGALRHRNYRLFFAGQVISTVGTWMSSIAQSWLVLQLTHNAFLLGLVLAAQFTPMLLAAPLGGVVADRFRKRRVLLATQSLFILPALVLFLLTYAQVAQFWMVLLAAVGYGCINAFDVPARQSFVIEMVGRDDLMNAIALNSSVWNAAAIAGPSLAGLLIAAVGLPLCFLLNGASYLAAVCALLLMRNLPRLVGDRAPQPALKSIREGAAYAARDPLVGMMLIAVAAVSVFAMNRLTLLPLFADSVLGVGPAGFGFLTAFLGAGAVAGALSIATLGRRATGRLQFWVGIAWSAALLAFSISRVFGLSAVLLLISGFMQMWFLATANTRIQKAAPDRLRGRVMSLYAQALMGLSPLGSLQSGTLAAVFGPPVAMAVGAIAAGMILLGIRLARPEVFAAEVTHPASGGPTRIAG